jgi:hypothetical protein
MINLLLYFKKCVYTYTMLITVQGDRNMSLTYNNKKSTVVLGGNLIVYLFIIENATGYQPSSSLNKLWVKFAVKQAIKTHRKSSCRSTLSWTSALKVWVVDVMFRPLYIREINLVTIVQKVGWAAGPAETYAETLAPTGFRSPERPSFSESVYGLSYQTPLSKL